LWASLFAAQGFWHDVEFDTAFLTPWAMRFRKTGDPAPRAVIPLERTLWRLRRENTALRGLANGVREDASPAEPSAAEAPQAAVTEERGLLWSLLQEALDAANASAQGQAQRHELIALAAENSSLRRELARASTQLNELLYVQRFQEARLSYKLTRGVIKSADALLPEGSRRRAVYRQASQAARTLRGRPLTAPATTSVAPADDEAQ